MTDELTVACVLRHGGRYDGEWVRRLKGQLDHHLPGVDFLCLSEWHLSGVNTRIMAHRWEGWWSKVELFRPGLLTGRVLYLDLDTYVVGSLAEIASYDGDFAMLRDFLRADGCGSGVMAWTPGEHTEDIYHRFCRDPEHYRAAFQAHGDQAFIEDTVAKIDRLQDLYPGQILSYKAHEVEEHGLSADARLLCFHGAPKPDDLGWPHPDTWR